MSRHLQDEVAAWQGRRSCGACVVGSYARLHGCRRALLALRPWRRRLLRLLTYQLLDRRHALLDGHRAGGIRQTPGRRTGTGSMTNARGGTRRTIRWDLAAGGIGFLTRT